MPIVRCPECGRVADGSLCFACGYEWSESSEPDQSQSASENAGPTAGSTLPDPQNEPSAPGVPTLHGARPLSDPIAEAGDVLSVVSAEGEPVDGASNQMGDPFADPGAPSGQDLFAVEVSPVAGEPIDPFAPPQAQTDAVDDPFGALNPAASNDPFAPPPSVSSSNQQMEDPLAALAPAIQTTPPAQPEPGFTSPSDTSPLNAGAAAQQFSGASSQAEPPSAGPGPVSDGPFPTNPSSGQPEEVSKTTQYQYDAKDIDVDSPPAQDVEVDPSFVRAFSSSFALEGFDTSTPNLSDGQPSDSAISLSESAPLPMAWQKGSVGAEQESSVEVELDTSTQGQVETVSVPDLPSGWQVDDVDFEDSEVQETNDSHIIEQTTPIQPNQIIASADDPLLPAEVDPERISSEGAAEQPENQPISD